jgi:hypothetical protein
MYTAQIEGQSVSARDPFEKLLYVVVVILGVWGIYAQLTVLLGRSFLDLLAGTWISVLALGVFALILRGALRRGSAADWKHPEVGLSAPRVLGLAILAAAGLLIGGPGNPLVAGGYVLAMVLLAAMTGDHGMKFTVPQDFKRVEHRTGLVLLVLLAAIAVALGEHKANWDDANYLQTVANTLENQDQPLLVYENLHGVEDLKINHPAWRLQTYLLLVAGLAESLGVSYLKMYYLVLPPIWAGMAVIALWSILRRFAGSLAGLALATTFIVLVTWGSYRSYGSFSFAQLYTGRGIFLTFAVPALISATFQFAEKPNFRSWLYLFLTTWMGCLFSSTAYAVAPVAVALTLIACCGVTLRPFRRLMAGALAVAWCPLVMAYAVWVAPVVAAVDVDSRGGAHWIFSGTQGQVAFILFGLAPFFVVLARAQSSRWFLRYFALCFLIFFSGVVLDFSGKLFTGLSWRMLWAVPVPALIGVGTATGIDLCSKRVARNPKFRVVVTLILLASVAATFSFAGNTVVFRNFGWPRLKVDTSAFRVAQALVRCSKPTDLVLAPTRIAVPMAGLIAAPSLIGVRGHFLSRLSAQWGEEETQRRRRLFRMVAGKDVSAENIAWAQNEILTSPIRRIVLYRNDDKTGPLKDLLRSLDIPQAEIRGWEIWLPHNSTEEVAEVRSCLLHAGQK